MHTVAYLAFGLGGGGGGGGEGVPGAGLAIIDTHWKCQTAPGPPAICYPPPPPHLHSANTQAH